MTKKAAILIFLLALVVRLSVAYDLFHSDILSYAPPPGTDMHYHLEASDRVAKGTFNEPFFHRSFYYFVFLSTIQELFGSSPLAPILIQVLLGALTVLLIGVATSKAFGDRAGLCAALLCCFYREHILFDSYLLTPILVTFFTALLAATLTATHAPRSLCFALTSGMLVGILVVIQEASILLLFPVLWFIWCAPPPLKFTHKVLPFVITILSFTCTLTPIVLWNLLRSGLPVLTIAGPFDLLFANFPLATPGMFKLPEVLLYWGNLLKHESPFHLLLSLVRWIGEQPFAYLATQIRKALDLFGPAIPENNVVIAEGVQHSATLQLPIYIPSVILFSLCIGFFLLLCTRRPLVLCASSASTRTTYNQIVLFMLWLLTVASLLPIFAVERYRILLGVLTIPFAAAFLTALLAAFESPLRSARLRVVAVLIGGLVSTLLVIPNYGSTFEPWIYRIVAPHGICIGANNTRFTFDYSSEYFGGWTPLTLLPSQSLVKVLPLVTREFTPRFVGIQFAKDLSPKEVQELELFVQTSDERWLKLTSADLQRWDTRVLNFALPSPSQFEDSQSLSILVSSSASLPLIKDTQRMYNRTQICEKGGSPTTPLHCTTLNGEVVMHLLSEKREQEH